MGVCAGQKLRRPEIVLRQRGRNVGVLLTMLMRDPPNVGMHYLEWKVTNWLLTFSQQEPC